jgi:hypothetical protein
MRRKTFIWASLVVTAGSVGSALIYTVRKQRLLKKPLAYPSYLASFMEESDIRKIGISYRLKNRHENDLKQLEDLIRKELPSAPDSEKKATPLIEHLENATTKNFENNNIIVTNGWILSVTEARQCALFSFTQ